MFRALTSIVTVMAIFVVVGTAVSALMMRRGSASIEVRYRLPDGADAGPALSVLGRRAEILAGEFRVSHWSMEDSGGELRLLARGRGDLERFSTLLARRGIIGFHEAAPAGSPDGPLDCPEGFEEASFSDWVYRTKEDFGEKVERRTDIFVRQVPEMEVSGLADCAYHTVGIFREPVIALSFRPDDADRFREITGRLQGKLMAICIDRKVRAAAKVTAPIADGRVEIRGLRDNDTAKRLAVMLRVGALPTDLERVEDALPEAMKTPDGG